MNKLLLTISFIVLFQAIAFAQIRVNPTGVNVNSQNPTTVFLTFGPVPSNYVPAEAVWCGVLIPAPQAIGKQCRRDTIYGVLPARFNNLRRTRSLTQAPTPAPAPTPTPPNTGGSDNDIFRRISYRTSEPQYRRFVKIRYDSLTDIMAIPSSVVRRAYQATQNGGDAGFFYVRRFISTNGAPDQFISVTCRMSGGGARVPFALTNVEIETSINKPILFIKSGEKFPEIAANIKYNGTGRLKGRWEIVQPGEEPPNTKDLLTEATLPIEQRSTQKRYTQISRFNHFLPPTGKFKLPLKLNKRMSTLANGQYLLLLRIEATNDKESSSNLAAIGVGNGVVRSGAVASFPMPVLKFFVLGNNAKTDWEHSALVLPEKETAIDINLPLLFSWKPLQNAVAYRLEILDMEDKMILSAILLSPNTIYRAPSWFWKRFANQNPSWRVAALDGKGKTINKTKSRKIVMSR